MAVRMVPVTRFRTEVGLSLAQMSAGPSLAATVLLRGTDLVVALNSLD